MKLEIKSLLIGVIIGFGSIILYTSFTKSNEIGRYVYHETDGYPIMLDSQTGLIYGDFTKGKTKSEVQAVGVKNWLNGEKDFKELR